MNTTSIHTGAFKSVPLLNYHPVDTGSAVYKILYTAIHNMSCTKSLLPRFLSRPEVYKACSAWKKEFSFHI